MNRLGNCKNPFQGSYKKVLCVCSAGLLRSPTAALVLSQEPFNFNTRAAGISNEYALILVDQVLISWADEIVVMTKEQRHKIEVLLHKMGIPKSVVCLDIPDNFAYRDAELQKLIAGNYQAAVGAAVEVRPKEKKKDKK